VMKNGSVFRKVPIIHKFDKTRMLGAATRP
jgi:hypothetical protein